MRDGDKKLLRSNIATPFKDLVAGLKNQNVDPQMQDHLLQDTWDSVDAFH